VSTRKSSQNQDDRGFAAAAHEHLPGDPGCRYLTGIGASDRLG
jgi:hypothetical protein